MIELPSLRSENAVVLAAECPFVYVAQLLGTHWRPAILYKILTGVNTYNALRTALGIITDKSLALELKTLIELRLILREEIAERPRRTRYEATLRGKSLLEVLTAMEAWAQRDRCTHGPSAPDDVG